MAKFALHNSNGSLAEEFEGDYMMQDKEFVRILENVADPKKGDTQVAAIHLAAGQSVKVIKDR